MFVLEKDKRRGECAVSFVAVVIADDEIQRCVGIRLLFPLLETRLICKQSSFCDDSVFKGVSFFGKHWIPAEVDWITTGFFFSEF